MVNIIEENKANSSTVHDVGEKKCAECLTEKPLSDFYSIKCQKRGIRFEKICKECKRLKSKVRYQQQKDNSTQNDEYNKAPMVKDLSEQPKRKHESKNREKQEIKECEKDDLCCEFSDPYIEDIRNREVDSPHPDISSDDFKEILEVILMLARQKFLSEHMN